MFVLYCEQKEKCISMHNQTLASDRSSLLNQIDHICILGIPNPHLWNLLARDETLLFVFSIQYLCSYPLLVLWPCSWQDDYDKELEYLPCETGKGQSICVAAKRLNQQFYQRLCASKFDYEWNLKTQCKRDEYGYRKSGFCEVGLCIANIG